MSVLLPLLASVPLAAWFAFFAVVAVLASVKFVELCILAARHLRHGRECFSWRSITWLHAHPDRVRQGVAPYERELSHLEPLAACLSHPEWWERDQTNERLVHDEDTADPDEERSQH